MTGRGIDQILPHPCDPVIHEGYLRSARDYVELAERVSGQIAYPVRPGYVWGDALEELDRRQPDFRVVNLETSITARGRPVLKGINYRMHPDNVGCLTIAGLDCCVLANNHVLDWGPVGLEDTLATLEQAGVRAAGAGRSVASAERPAILATADGRRLVVLAFALPSSGVPPQWAAGEGRAGVSLLAATDTAAVAQIAGTIDACSKPGDIVLLSLHWGPNWGYGIPDAFRRFAHDVIDGAGIDIVHGHSSHHPLAMEVHQGKPILYGCGDFINDYEGIGGRWRFRPDLRIGYFLEIGDRTRTAERLELTVFQSDRLRLRRASPADIAWMQATLDRECRRFGSRVALVDEATLRLCVP